MAGNSKRFLYENLEETVYHFFLGAAIEVDLLPALKFNLLLNLI